MKKVSALSLAPADKQALDVFINKLYDDLEEGENSLYRFIHTHNYLVLQNFFSENFYIFFFSFSLQWLVVS